MTFDRQMLWFANRGTGVVLIALLTLSTAIGVLSTARAGTAKWPRFATQALHRNVSLMAAALLAAHAVFAVVDTFVDIRWFDAFLPFGAKYSPLYMALGALALDLMVLIIVSSLIRHRMSHRNWRAIHLFAYASWALGVVHGIGIGTDTRSTTWGVGVNVLSVGVVASIAVIRLATLAHERKIAA
jgi:methionine sulfoxide reductase heme-binding subunit